MSCARGKAPVARLQRVVARTFWSGSPVRYDFVSVFQSKFKLGPTSSILHPTVLQVAGWTVEQHNYAYVGSR